MSTNQRIRGRKLQTIRRRRFSIDPLCVSCRARGIVRAWTQIDHIVPIAEGGADDDTNRQGLCDACHALKSGYRPRPVIGVDGWPRG